MIVNQGYLINLQEFDEIINRFDNIIGENLNEGGIIDQRFNGALILINMLFEKIEKLTEQVATFSNNLGELKEDFKLLSKRLNWYQRHHKRLLACHQNLRGQVESNVIALNQRIDDLALDFEKLKI